MRSWVDSLDGGLVQDEFGGFSLPALYEVNYKKYAHRVFQFDTKSYVFIFALNYYFCTRSLLNKILVEGLPEFRLSIISVQERKPNISVRCPTPANPEKGVMNLCNDCSL